MRVVLITSLVFSKDFFDTYFDFQLDDFLFDD
jgi:hypothetical protein